jgi:hypothetical protein
MHCQEAQEQRELAENLALTLEFCHNRTMNGRLATRLLAAMIAFAASLAGPAGRAEQSAELGAAQICAVVWLSERTRRQLVRRHAALPERVALVLRLHHIINP